MTNGEEEINGGGQASIPDSDEQPVIEAQPDPASQADSEPQIDPAPQVAPEPQATYGAPQAPPVEKKSYTKIILIAFGLLLLCCLGIGALLVTGIVILPDWEPVPDYTSHTVGSQTFKIPAGFEKNQAKNDKKYVEFTNGSDKFIRIVDMNSQLEIYAFALLIAQDLNVDGNRVYINGTPAYKFSTVDMDGTGQSTWAYAMNVNGNNYVFIFTKNIPNSEELLANMTST